MSEQAVKRSAKEMIVGYFRDFRVLKETRSEYWGIQLINFLDCTFYFAMLTIASVFLSQDLGLDDKSAGYTITVFTSATTLLLFVSGMFTDWLGIKKSMYISMIALLVLRLGMVFVGISPWLPYRGFIAGGLFLLMAPFMAGVQTVFQASCARFTTRRSRSAGFNLWYLFMNVGAAAGGYSIDFVRLQLKLPNVHIFTMGVATAILCIAATLLMVHREEQLVGAGETTEDKKEGVVVERKKPLQILKEIISEKAFYRLLVLIALILGVRAVYTYIYLLMPKYWLRTIGPDAAIGKLNMINPIGIVIGLILFIPITNRFNIFKMLVYGAMISALSLAPMAAPWQWYGIGIIDAHYLMAILCMILLTIGEVVWSPKLNEYTAAIAPKGQEGTYLGMSLIPWFLAKTFVSLLSGHMLERWSPETVSVARQTLQSAGITPTVLADNLGARELARLAPQLGVDFSNQFAKLEPNAVAAQAQNLGFQVKTIANGAAYDSVIEQLKALKVPMVDFFTTTAQTVMLQVKQLGIDVFDLTQKIEAATLALKLKIVGVDVAKAVLQPGVNPAVTKVDVNFQLVLQRGWVDYWHSPGAMWLLLGAIAMGGCVVAAMLGGWLTEGARWKIEEHK